MGQRCIRNLDLLVCAMYPYAYNLSTSTLLIIHRKLALPPVDGTFRKVRPIKLFGRLEQSAYG